MQDRFVGDIGDYGKYGLLRALALPPLCLGVIWYRTLDGDFGGDRIGYLNRPDLYHRCDPSLFDALSKIGREGRKNIELIRFSGIFPETTVYAEDLLASSTGSRNDWFEAASALVENCDLVYLDPDNGFAPSSIPRSRSRACHYVYPEEIECLRKRGHSVLFYHHLSRRKPAREQIRELFRTLGSDASGIRFHRGGSRIFILFPAPDHRVLLHDRIHRFLTVTPWREHFTRAVRCDEGG